MVYVDVQKLNFSYDDKVQIFNNLNLSFDDYNSYAIMGPSACGKTTLINCINGNLKYSGDINLNESLFTYVKKTVPIIHTVEETDKFTKKTLREEFESILLIRGFRERDLKFLIDEFISYFNLDNIIDKKFKIMTYREEMISKVLIKTITRPDLILIDDIFKYLSNDFKRKYTKFLVGNNITLINVISDINDALYTEYLVVLLSNSKIAIEGPTISVLKEEKLLRRIGFDLPFMVDLSIQLNCYGLLDKIYLNKEEMVNKLWK